MSKDLRRDKEQEEPHVLGMVNHVSHLLFKLAVIAVFGFALFYGIRAAYDFGYSVFTTGPAEEAPGREVEVTILTGMSTRSVGSLLTNAGVIRNATVFYVQAMIYGYEIKPGTYLFNTSQSMDSILIKLAQGPDS
ncbi:MAG: endolytic transglycosylase MltG [Lachnospiraceae bacterium]|nr:endolytic transglycosylase MltG [Lachnospiraceae bacterium]